jgi:hypothetical protein
VADERPKRTRKPAEATRKTTRATKPKETARKTPARKAAATPRARRDTRPVVTHDQIAARAYQLHLEGNGDAFANWLRAETELATA